LPEASFEPASRHAKASAFALFGWRHRKVLFRRQKNESASTSQERNEKKRLHLSASIQQEAKNYAGLPRLNQPTGLITSWSR